MLLDMKNHDYVTDEYIDIRIHDSYNKKVNDEKS